MNSCRLRCYFLDSLLNLFFFFSSRRRHTRYWRDWSSDVCSSDLNLLGDTNAVHVSVDETGRFTVDEVVEGDTVREVLQYVQFSADDLKRAMRKSVERALRDQKLTIDESRVLLKFYENGLEGYTYLE